MLRYDENEFAEYVDYRMSKLICFRLKKKKKKDTFSELFRPNA